MKTFKLFTLGCKVNQYESEAIRESLLAAGFKEVNSSKPAAFYLINSCTVTSRADSKSLDLIRRAKRENPLCKVVLTGCLVSGKVKALRRKTKADYIVTNQLKYRLAEIIKSHRLPGKEGAEYIPLQVNDFKGHSRAFVKIQDGCNNSCSYCKIPLVRGSSRSRPLNKIREEAENLVKKGFKEIVLTGICLGAYGRDLPKVDNAYPELADVIEELEKIKSDFRVRLSSIEARDISGRLIKKFSQSKRLCPHLHIPFQSGDDGILRKMQRHYRVQDYLKLVRGLRKAIPEIAITTDIMVGFPSENEAQFRNTLRFIKTVSPSRIHIFPFSPREGTAAEDLPDRGTSLVIRKREAALRSLARETAYSYYSRFKNRMLKVLAEHKRDRNSGLLKGYTQNYIPVVFAGSDRLKGKLVKVVIKNIDADPVLAKAG